MRTLDRNPPAPTYQLDPDTKAYYRDVSALVDEVLEVGARFRGLIASRGRLAAEHDGQPASHEESLLDLLTLGVLWVARGREAIMLSPLQRNLVTELVRERRNGSAKRRDGSQNRLLDYDAPLAFSALQPSPSDLQKLRDWLLATGEYDDEVARIEPWLSFFASPTQDQKQEPLRELIGLANTFAARAESRLGRYTERVEDFLLERLPQRQQCEDAVQCSRRRLEYHLNLFAAELLNRIWRDEFLASKERVVVLAACTRKRRDAECRAIRGATALHCTHCTRDCTVSAVTRMAERYHATAVAVVHGSDFTQFLETARSRGPGTGIIGVACAPGIMGAGLRAKSMGLPAQCVVLDASGCEHWRTQGIPSSLDLGELERLLTGSRRVSTTDAGAQLRAS